jgi:hypothetical protein
MAFRVAALQLDPPLGEVDRGLERIERAVGEAAAAVPGWVIVDFDGTPLARAGTTDPETLCWCLTEQLRHRRRGVDDLLEVVRDRQGRSIAQMVGQPCDGRRGAGSRRIRRAQAPERLTKVHSTWLASSTNRR